MLGFGLHHRNHEVRFVAQEIVRTLLGTPLDFQTGDDDPPVGEGALLGDLVVVPAGAMQPGHDVFAAGVGFTWLVQ